MSNEEKLGTLRRNAANPLPLARRLGVDHVAITSLLVPTADAGIVAEAQR